MDYKISSDSELGEDGSSRESPTEELSVGPRYQLLASNKMMGKYSISNVKVGSVACGIMGCLGNKGPVFVSLSIESSTSCFVAAYLASGEKDGDDRILWFGDLNYKLGTKDVLARELVRSKDWIGLQQIDQLREELQDFGGVFQGDPVVGSTNPAVVKLQIFPQANSLPVDNQTYRFLRCTTTSITNANGTQENKQQKGAKNYI
ncbi:hypothetical protein C5167_042664 [Papaver somniferum]|uniref:Inositol polyphosphate-related phosphatase domain-containing protein n=1 Tax=Papaver somniferum TaxID=3469 RepID=A0A4Y7L739_PAPSO|nr:hypothetical protein C5167_042664 [Papaver somniferum]